MFDSVMIGSLFKELQIIPTDEQPVPAVVEDVPLPSDGNETLLEAIPVVQKIVRRRFLLNWHSEAGDLVQGIALRLLKWRDKYRAQSDRMSAADWQSFAARAAYNEINRHYSKQTQIPNVPLEAVPETAAPKTVGGDSEAEVISLIRVVWREICKLSLRQRRALLLSSQELNIYLLQSGVSDHELAGTLDLGIEEWTRIKEDLPLSDLQIAKLQIPGNAQNPASIAKSIKKARYEARLRIRRLLEK